MVELAMLSVFRFILAIGGFVADYIFPHIKPLQRYIDSLPMMEEDEEPDEDCVELLLKEEAS